MSKLENIMPRGDKSIAEAGHNNDKLLQDYVIRFAKKQLEIEKLSGEGKEILREAKNDGFLKTSIRKAVKNLRMTPEQVQAKQEVEDTTKTYMEICGDLPLFQQASAEAA